MGVKLKGVIVKKQISFNDLKNKKIAVDFSNSAYQFLSNIRQVDGTPLMDSQGRITSHLQGLFSRTINLMSRNIKLAYVFDGKPPLLKVKEQEQRAYRKEIAKEKYEEAKKKEDIYSMQKYAKQTSRLSKEMVDESKELVKALGLPAIQAPSEADPQMAFMNEQNDVDYTGSSDVDCLLYGSTRLVTNLTLSQRRKLPSGGSIKINPEVILLKETLDNLGINNDQLLVIAILVGTDYNDGVKGIGPKTALKLVKTHNNFDKVFEEAKADFNWKKIYAVFKSMPIMRNYQLKWNPVNREKIFEILVEEHDFKKERIENSLNKLEGIKKDKSQRGLGDFVNG